MEFLKELDVIWEEYYNEGDAKWISQHLEGDASVWWRIIKQNVKTYTEFQETFREKFWNHIVQEEVRDNLEFGRYHHADGLAPIQYIERRVLENRQLIPPMSDRANRTALFKVEVASITRGIKEIPAFELLLKEL